MLPGYTIELPTHCAHPFPLGVPFPLPRFAGVQTVEYFIYPPGVYLLIFRLTVCAFVPSRRPLFPVPRSAGVHEGRRPETFAQDPGQRVLLCGVRVLPHHPGRRQMTGAIIQFLLCFLFLLVFCQMGNRKKLAILYYAGCVLHA